jgi:hypothetical protein
MENLGTGRVRGTESEARTLGNTSIMSGSREGPGEQSLKTQFLFEFRLLTCTLHNFALYDPEHPAYWDTAKCPPDSHIYVDWQTDAVDVSPFITDVGKHDL